MKLSKISWYAKALRVPFTETKWLSPTPEKQITIIPPLHQTLVTKQSDYSPNPDSFTELPDRKARFLIPSHWKSKLKGLGNNA